MGNELISIITPFRNSSKYLDECLNSIINQSYKDWELIIVDDYSTDKSFEIVKEFAFIDKRIKLYRNNKKGIIGALKLGYNLSVGKYITRMDSDDVMHVDKLQELCHNLKKKGNGFLATSAVEYFSSNRLGNGYKNYQNWINWLMMKNNHFEHIYKECVIPSPNWMISRKDFDKIGAFNSNVYPEDYELVFRMYEKKINIISSNKTLHYWRDYSNRTSRIDSNYADNQFLDLKIHFFMKLNYNRKKELFIWGAGEKGKNLAKKLLNLKLNFKWVCNNPKKIGKKIYGIELLDVKFLNKIDDFQSIITVANKDAQIIIRNYFKQRNLIPMKDYFFFC